VKLLRGIFAQPALAAYVGDEQWPGPDAVSDKAIADAIMAARRVDHADDPGRAAEHDRDHEGGALR
jgi:hypothetical protein